MSFPGTAQISILSFRTNSFPPQVPTAVPGPPHFSLSYKLHACQFSIHFGYFISHILRKRLYVSTSRQKAHKILYKPSETSE